MHTKTILFGIASAVLTANAQEAPDSPWRVGIAYRLGLNYEIKVRNRSLPPAPNNPSLNGRTYSDGFVGTDASGNAMGLTSFWGYEDAARQTVGDALVLRQSASGRITQDDATTHGFEIVAGRELGRTEGVRWGLEAGFGFSALDEDRSGGVPTGLSSLDAYPLGGVIPPQGSYTGPQTPAIGAPLLGTAAGNVPFSLRSDISANIFHFRVGPYLEIPIRERFALGLAAGLALDLVDSSVELDEIAPAPYAAFSRSYRDDELNTALGAFLNLTASYRVTDQWSVTTGFHFQSLENVSHNVGDKAVSFNSDGTVYFVLGTAFHF